MANRFIPSAVSKVVFAPSVSNLAAPSSGEISAGVALLTPGTSIVEGLKEMAGWETDSADVVVPDAATRFDNTIPGRTSAKSPTTLHYSDETGAPGTIRTALAEGTAGYMIIMKQGQTTGRRCEVWPCRVSTIVDSPVNSGNEASMFTVKWTISASPNKTAVVP